MPGIKYILPTRSPDANANAKRQHANASANISESVKDRPYLKPTQTVIINRRRNKGKYAKIVAEGSYKARPL